MALRVIVDSELKNLEVIDYSRLSDEQLDSSIQYYENQHGSLEEFSGRIGKYPLKRNSDVKVDWEHLLKEREERQSRQP